VHPLRSIQMPQMRVGYRGVLTHIPGSGAFFSTTRGASTYQKSESTPLKNAESWVEEPRYAVCIAGSIMKSTPNNLALAIAILAGIVGPSCSSSSGIRNQPDASSDSAACSYAGTLYPVGASFKSTDGCNTCSCGPGLTVACTLMACLTDAGVTPAPDASPKDGAVIPDAPAQDLRPTMDTASTDRPPAPDSGSKDALVSVDAGPTDAKVLAEVALADAKASADAGCFSGNHVYAVGESFKNDCNTCSCRANGAIACTEMLCLADAAAQDAPAGCTVPTVLTFGYDGGNALWRDVNRLDPSGLLTITRTMSGRGGGDGGSTSCSRALPACGTAGAVTAATIAADLADADVKAGFAAASTPFYGADQRPVDGPAYSIAQADGHSFLVGAPCSSSSGSTCRAIPAGMRRLVDDLMSAASAALDASVCQGL
jgi:hypothetical protein